MFKPTPAQRRGMKSDAKYFRLHPWNRFRARLPYPNEIRESYRMHGEALPDVPAGCRWFMLVANDLPDRMLRVPTFGPADGDPNSLSQTELALLFGMALGGRVEQITLDFTGGDA